MSLPRTPLECVGTEDLKHNLEELDLTQDHEQMHDIGQDDVSCENARYGQRVGWLCADAPIDVWLRGDVGLGPIENTVFHSISGGDFVC